MSAENENRKPQVVINILGFAKDYAKHIIYIVLTAVLTSVSFGIWKYTVSFVNIPDEVTQLRQWQKRDSTINALYDHKTDSVVKAMADHYRWIDTLWNHDAKRINRELKTKNK